MRTITAIIIQPCLSVLGVQPTVVDDFISAIRSRVVVPRALLEPADSLNVCDSVTAGPVCGAPTSSRWEPRWLTRGFGHGSLIDSADKAEVNQYLTELGRFVSRYDNLNTIRAEQGAAPEIIEWTSETPRVPSGLDIRSPTPSSSLPQLPLKILGPTTIRLPGPFSILSVRGFNFSLKAKDANGHVLFSVRIHGYSKHPADAVSSGIPGDFLFFEIDELVLEPLTNDGTASSMQSLKLSYSRNSSKHRPALVLTTNSNGKISSASRLIPPSVSVVDFNEAERTWKWKVDKVDQTGRIVEYRRGDSTFSKKPNMRDKDTELDKMIAAVVQGLESDLEKIPGSQYEPLLCEIHNCTPFEKLVNVLLSAATVEPMLTLQNSMGLNAWVRFIILSQLLKTGGPVSERQVTDLVRDVMNVLEGPPV